MDISIFLMLTLLILLIFMSAFFSSSETAFLSLSAIKIRQLSKTGSKKALLIKKLKSNTNNLLTTILIGNNLTNSFSSSIATALAISIVGKNGTGIATIIMTILIIIFGEILPKTIATYKPVKVAKATASYLAFLENFLFPFVFLFSKLTVGITKLVESFLPQSPGITEEELKTLIDVGEKEGTLENNEKEMLYKIFEFSDLRARDIQKHRSLVKSLSIDASYEETLSFIANCGFSRIPIWNKTPLSICGIIHFKDVLFFNAKKEKFSIKKIMHPVLFIPETKPALELLYFFKHEQQHFAIVVNEHGSNSGIITMDDLLKAVFGRITDEYNTSNLPAEDRITIINSREYVFPGDIAIQDVNTIFSLDLKSDDCTTIGGWLTEQFGFLPESSEMLRHDDILFRVEDQTQRRIQTIRMIFTAHK